MGKTLVDQIREVVKCVVTPGDEDYEKARVGWNRGLDAHPAAVLYCDSAEEVSAATKVLINYPDAKFVVRCGGHSFYGASLINAPGVILDLTRINHVDIVTDDPAGPYCWVGGGALWGTVDAKTAPLGFATPGGVVNDTGVGGLALGGGFGFLSRKFGLVVDNILAVDMVRVTDGAIIRCDNEQNSDFFWALRGSAGAIGIVTAFKLRLHKIGDNGIVYGGARFVDYEAHGKELLRYFMNKVAAEPFGVPIDEATYFAIADPPPLNFKRAVVIQSVYAGSLAEGESVVAPQWVKPWPSIGEPEFGPIPYHIAQSISSNFAPPGHCWVVKHVTLRQDKLIEAADTIFQIGLEKGPTCAILVEPWGGAVGAVGKDATPLSAIRTPDHCVLVAFLGMYMSEEQKDQVREWAQSSAKKLAPYVSQARYVNYGIDEDDILTETAFGENLTRLRKIREVADPKRFLIGEKRHAYF